MFYYKFASDNVRAGKERFYLPFRSNTKDTYSNMYILRLFDENFIATFLQDFNIKDIRIYVKHHKIIDLFKDLFAKKISRLVQKSSTKMLEETYQNIDSILTDTSCINILKSHLTSGDIHRLKDTMYTFHFQLQQDIFERMAKLDPVWKKQYTDMTILGIITIMMDTLL